MPPHQPPKPARNKRWTRPALGRTALGAFAVLIATALVLSATAAKPEDQDNSGGDAVVTVVFDEDGLGYNVTSTKDLSNIIVDFCVQDDFKYDDLTGKNFTGSENASVAGLWVKSGNNGDANNTTAPPGAGVYIANEAVDCDPEPTCEDLGNCPEETCEDRGDCVEETCEDRGDCVEETCEDRGDCPDEGEEGEVPFFTSPATLLLGTLGALGGAMAILVRRKP